MSWLKCRWDAGEAMRVHRSLAGTRMRVPGAGRRQEVTERSFSLLRGASCCPQWRSAARSPAVCPVAAGRRRGPATPRSRRPGSFTVTQVFHTQISEPRRPGWLFPLAVGLESLPVRMPEGHSLSLKLHIETQRPLRPPCRLLTRSELL